MMMQSHARSEGAGGLSAPSPLSPTAKVSVSHSSPPTHHISLSPLVSPLALAVQVRAAEQMSSSDVETLVAAALKELRADPNHNAKAGDRVYGKSTEFKLMMATIPTLAPQLSHRQIMQLVPLPWEHARTARHEQCGVVSNGCCGISRPAAQTQAGQIQKPCSHRRHFDGIGKFHRRLQRSQPARHRNPHNQAQCAWRVRYGHGNSDGHLHHEEPREWDPSGLLTFPLVASYILAHTPPPS